MQKGIGFFQGRCMMQEHLSMQPASQPATSARMHSMNEKEAQPHSNI
jgi:hypothetical protein